MTLGLFCCFFFLFFFIIANYGEWIDFYLTLRLIIGKIWLFFLILSVNHNLNSAAQPTNTFSKNAWDHFLTWPFWSFPLLFVLFLDQSCPFLDTLECIQQKLHRPPWENVLNAPHFKVYCSQQFWENMLLKLTVSTVEKYIQLLVCINVQRCYFLLAFLENL